MDLLKKMQTEIDLLNLTDKLEIARFLYIRTGELFGYDQAYNTYGYRKSIKMYKKILDTHKIKSFKIICASWAHLYKELLDSFDISAKYVDCGEFCHAYVKFWIGRRKYIADLTDFYADITKIKFGFQTSCFYRETFIKRLRYLLNFGFFSVNQSYKMFNIDKRIGYFKGIYTDEVLKMIKKEIYEQKYADYSEWINEVLEIVMLFINIERPYVEFHSGYVLIKKLLEYFLGDYKNFICCTDVYDKERIDFMGVFVNSAFDVNRVYLYKKNKEGYYKLKEISKKKIAKIESCYECSNERVLKLAKN